MITPNVPEAEVLAGMNIGTEDDRREAARRIVASGAQRVVIKGGHLPTDEIVDLLYDGIDFVEFRHQRIPGSHTHGTGCTFAAALASNLALGRTLREAIPLAQRYIAGAIRNAPKIGGGHGPVDHLWDTFGLSHAGPAEAGH